jgi:hypothetical protein
MDPKSDHKVYGTHIFSLLLRMQSVRQIQPDVSDVPGRKYLTSDFQSAGAG